MEFAVHENTVLTKLKCITVFFTENLADHHVRRNCHTMGNQSNKESNSPVIYTLSNSLSANLHSILILIRIYFKLYH